MWKQRAGGRRSASYALVAAVMAACAGAVPGATATWSNALGDGIWSASGNWVGGNPPGPGQEVVFPAPGPASHVVLLPPSAVGVGLLTFGDSYTLHSGQLNLLNSGGPISVAAGKTATLNSVLGSNVGVTVSGGGTLVLGGNNSTTLTAGTDFRINAGSTVGVSADANLGSVQRVWTAGTLEVYGTFSSAKRIEPSNGAILVTAGNTLSLTGNDQFGFSNSDTWTKLGEGTLRVTGHSSRFGTTYLQAGVTRLEGGDIGYGPYILGNATLEAAATMFGNYLSNAVTLGTGSVLRGIGNVQANNVKGAAGDIFPTLASGNSSSDVFTVQMNTFGGTIGSTITVAGPGTVALHLATNYPGAWNVSSGTLRVTQPGALGPGLGPVSVASGGTLHLSAISTGKPITLNGGSRLWGSGNGAGAARIIVADGISATLGTPDEMDVLSIGELSGGVSSALAVNAAGTIRIIGPSAYAGAWNILFGRLQLQNSSALGTGTDPITIALNGQLRTGAAVASTRSLVVSGGTVDDFGQSSSFGKVSGSGMVKIGLGTLQIDRIRSGSLNVGTGTLRIKPDSALDAVSTLDSLIVSASAKLDLTDNKLIVRGGMVGSWSGTAYTDLTGHISTGRNGGTWDGNGIITSDTRALNDNGLCSVGIALASQVKGIADTETATFAGQTVLGKDVLLMFTYAGDANLDGVINIDDYGRIDSNVAQSGGVFGWFNGDFNYDGAINIDDYGIIDGNINRQGAAFSSAADAGPVAVPEPTSISILCTIGALLVRRRRGGVS